MPYRYRCSKCDLWHEGFSDLSYDRPGYAADVPEEERGTRVFLTSDLCVVDDEHFFIRCNLRMRVKGTDDDFGWGIWSTLSKEKFLRYQKHYDEDMSGWDPMFGYLSNSLPNYPETKSLRLSVQPTTRGLRPLATLEPTDHPLAVDQREGISLERALKFTEPFLHGE